MRPSACLLALWLAGAPALSAQARPATAPVHALTPARTLGGRPAAAVVAARPMSRQTVIATNPVVPAGVVPFTAVGTPLTLEQLLNPAPGLGFDFAHLEAINSNLAVRALIDPVTQQTLALVRGLPQVSPIVPIGFGFGPAPVVVVEQPPVVVVQSPQASAPSPPAPEVAAPAPAAGAAPAPSAAPDIGNFVLVLRSGKTVDAAGFTVHGSLLVYIAPDGSRHTLPLDALDLPTTLERNAERGSFLSLPR
jgi:hypothetical protein